MSNFRWSILTVLALLGVSLTFAKPSQESQAPAPAKHAEMQHEESADQHLQMLSEKQKRTKMKSIHESLHDQINAVLTPEQQAKFKQMKQEHMQKHNGMEEGKPKE